MLARALAADPCERFEDASLFAGALREVDPATVPAIPPGKIPMASLSSTGLPVTGAGKTTKLLTGDEAWIADTDELEPPASRAPADDSMQRAVTIPFQRKLSARQSRRLSELAGAFEAESTSAEEIADADKAYQTRTRGSRATHLTSERDAPTRFDEDSPAVNGRRVAVILLGFLCVGVLVGWGVTWWTRGGAGEVSTDKVVVETRPDPVETPSSAGSLDSKDGVDAGVPLESALAPKLDAGRTDVGTVQPDTSSLADEDEAPVERHAVERHVDRPDDTPAKNSRPDRPVEKSAQQATPTPGLEERDDSDPAEPVESESVESEPVESESVESEPPESEPEQEGAGWLVAD